MYRIGINQEMGAIPTSHLIFLEENEKDLSELSEEVKQRLNFTAAETVDEVLAVALEKQSPKPASSGEPGKQLPA